MKKAIITGIAGQDGAYLSKLLLEKGYAVFGVDLFAGTKNYVNLITLGILDDIRIHNIDLMDIKKVRMLIENICPDEIYNLAAQSSVGKSFKFPQETVNFNIISTENILEAIRMGRQKTRFYQASSSEMFGRLRKDELPIREAHAFHPVSPYGISKAAAHWLTVNYREAYGMFACCGILFNHESVFRPDGFVTKKIIKAAIGIKEKKAKQVVLGNLAISRDWGYAPEYVKAMWLMLQQDKPDDFIICSGKAHTLRQFLNEAFKYFGLDYRDYLKIDQRLFRPNDLKIIYGDNSKAKEKIGWEYNLSFKQLIHQLIEDELALR